MLSDDLNHQHHEVENKSPGVHCTLKCRITDNREMAEDNECSPAKGNANGPLVQRIVQRGVGDMTAHSSNEALEDSEIPPSNPRGPLSCSPCDYYSKNVKRSATSRLAKSADVSTELLTIDRLIAYQGSPVNFINGSQCAVFPSNALLGIIGICSCVEEEEVCYPFSPMFG
jgi:hypothetical protein